MGIKAINVAYVEIEDRVLLRVQTDACEEFRFWLTRACLSVFVQRARSWLSGPGIFFAASDARHVFERQAGAQQTDFAAPYEEAKSFPLGLVPALVREIHIIDAGEMVSLEIRLVEEQSATLTLAQAQIAALCRLIQEVALGVWADVGHSIVDDACPSLLN
ncbi:hypothetical protein [Pandoraea sp. NPDC090278]|uniref:hypothetical protein n=1 Tax=Pandoraea sp. NPDC090278 TaxID=3364391 RepID=UPI00383A2BEC